MHDVAAHAGVSLKTVSRVVNGGAGVRPATIAKVESAVVALRFERNDVARSLRPGHRTQTLGLVIEDVANPFFSAITLGVDEVAQAHDYLLITASAREDAERERKLVTALLRRRVDALLLVPAAGDHRYIAHADASVKTVFLDRPPRSLEADAVLLDDVGGTEQAVAHLVAHGHRRIAFIGDESGVYTAERRLESYRRVMSARVGAVDEQLVVTAGGSNAQSEVEHAESAVGRLMALPARRRPTAILTNSNRVTLGVLRALGGRRDTVALVGFDEVELGELLGITVVRTDPLEMGRIAAELALERIHGRDDPPQRIVVPTELVVRGSGEIAA